MKYTFIALSALALGLSACATTGSTTSQNTQPTVTTTTTAPKYKKLVYGEEKPLVCGHETDHSLQTHM